MELVQEYDISTESWHEALHRIQFGNSVKSMYKRTIQEPQIKELVRRAQLYPELAETFRDRFFGLLRSQSTSFYTPGAMVCYVALIIESGHAQAIQALRQLYACVESQSFLFDVLTYALSKSTTPVSVSAIDINSGYDTLNLEHWISTSPEVAPVIDMTADPVTMGEQTQETFIVNLEDYRAKRKGQL